jgi:hypothetical protein
MAQLNFAVPDTLMAKIDAAKPEYLDRKGFLCLLLDQALDSAATLGAPDGTEGATSTSSIPIEVIPTRSRNKKGDARGKRDLYTVKAISADLVPSDLLDCQQLLPEFWAVKKGTRSQGVWNRVCGKLRGWTPEQRREALERAIASGWGDVFEPQSQPAPRTAAGGGRKTLDQLASEMDAMPALW